MVFIGGDGFSVVKRIPASPYDSFLSDCDSKFIQKGRMQDG